ncbi:MAG: DUF4139 domain-containing protein [Candidatus Odinarchaeota archaeon]|nr:DUF4139 domain-containing protein [Candidatus Odinarchaeota archaeon]
MKQIELKNPKIDRATIYQNGATVERLLEVELSAGENEILITNLEDDINSDSIRIFSEEGEIIVRSVDFELEKEQVSEVMSEDVEQLKKELKELEKQKDLLNETIIGIKNIIKSLDNGISRMINTFAIGALTGDVKEDKYSAAYEALGKEREEKAVKLIEKQKELAEINAKIEVVKSKLDYFMRKETITVGKISLLAISSKAQKCKLRVTYLISSAGWRPFYDVIISEDNTILVSYAQVIQNTSQKWDDVELIISSKRFKHVTKPKPEPWFIEPIPKPEIYPEAAPAPMLRATGMEPRAKKLAKPRRVEVEKAKFEEPEIEIGEFVTYRIKGRLSIPPSRPTLVKLRDDKLKSELVYIWDAFTTDSFVELAKITNGDITILPGKYRAYKDNILIGKSRFERIAPHQKIEVPITWEEKIETKRKQVEREEEKKGMIKDKAYIRVSYKLTVHNHKNKKIKCIVYDRMPHPRHPEIEVSLEEATPNPNKIELGILKWEFELDPEEKKEIRYKFVVKHSPDLELPSI